MLWTAKSLLFYKMFFFSLSLFAELTENSSSFPLKAYFTPSAKGCCHIIVKHIEKAKNSIYVQAYSFTEPAIAKALAQAHKRGITVQIILDKSQIQAKGSKLHYCHNKGIPIYIDKITGIAHNKVIIIDNTYTITGSYNFTQAAEKRNAENLLVIENKQIAQQYLQNWYNRWNYSYIYGKQQFREGENVGMMMDGFKKWLDNIFVDLQTCFP